MKSKWEELFRRKCLEVMGPMDSPTINGICARERIAEEFEIMEKECSALRDQVRHLESRIYGSCGQ
jgi:hypothetical protein